MRANKLILIGMMVLTSIMGSSAIFVNNIKSVKNAEAAVENDAYYTIVKSYWWADKPSKSYSTMLEVKKILPHVLIL